jgi:hypothetical protein
MKKRTTTGIALAVIALIALAALAVYLTLQYKEDTFAHGDSAIESEADALLLALHETEPVKTASASQDGSASESEKEDLFTIWVGDSRTIGMRDAMKNDDLYIGASGEGYDWLSEYGLPQLEDALLLYPDAPVVFNFGVNDYDNMSNYLALYASLHETYPDAHFYFLSVNPIDAAQCKNITNEEIADFNAHLAAAYPDAFIDSYTYLLVNEAVTIDGVHYSAEDYRKIHDFATEEIVKLENDM